MVGADCTPGLGCSDNGLGHQVRACLRPARREIDLLRGEQRPPFSRLGLKNAAGIIFVR